MNDREPQIAGGVPSCPDFIQGEARKEWHRVSHLLAGANLLTQTDQTALAAYCQAYGTWLNAEAQLRKIGWIVNTPNGYPVVSPYVSIAKQAFGQMCKLLVEFGMTPASRSRLRIEKPNTAEDPMDAYLKRGAAPQPERLQ